LARPLAAPNINTSAAQEAIMSDNEKNSPRDEPPPELVDPITLAVMVPPVFLLKICFL
jgi:hypothetical protein